LLLQAIIELARRQGLLDDGAPICVCAVVGGPPGAEHNPTGLLQVLNAPVPSGGYWKIASYFQEDTLRLELEGNPSLPAGRTDVTLRSGVGWAKEIAAWTYCAGTAMSIVHPGSNAALERGMRLRRALCNSGDADTIVFRKPKFAWFWWQDMYHWTSGPFWQLHDRRRAIYTWLQD
jgi:hypothetical protein